MAFNVGVLDAVDEEVAPDHRGIVVPEFEVGDGFVVDRGEAESLSSIINRITSGDCE